MKKIYGIIGAGKASPKAITTALDDLEKDAVFYVPVARSESMETVYDWLIDNEREFVVIGKAGKTLRDHSSEVIDTYNENLNIAILKYLQDAEATILVLWDDDITDAVYRAHGDGHRILELSNGLQPITVDDDAPLPEQEPEAEDDKNLTRSELESMPISAVKRYAVNYGLDIKGLGKEEIIDALFPPLALPATVEPATPSTDGTHISSIVVVFSNGCTLSLNGDADTLHRMVSVLA